MEPALRLQRVTKTFGATRAVDELDLVVPRGATYGFIGPSGAGKTTCIRMMMSILFPDSGALSVLGRPSALEAKDRIGYLPEERGVYRRMRVGDFLTFIAQLKGVPADDAVGRARQLLERVGLGDIEKKKCEELSKGMAHRVEFVAAVINRPELLILDEPFSGLDPVSVKLLKDLVAEEQRRGATILFSTHVMTQAEELCQHVVMIHRGRKVLDEPMAGLRRQYDPRVIQVEPLDERTPADALRAIDDVEQVSQTVDGFEVHLRPGTEPTVAMQRIAAAVPVARVAIARLRLEDVFLRLVAADAKDTDTEGALQAKLKGLGSEGALA
jgi:ABC-2 type transport system ATP-binding protein